MRADPAFIRDARPLSADPAAQPGRVYTEIPRSRRPRAAAASGTLLTALWAMLLPGDQASWVVGIPCVIGGAALSAVLAPARPSRISAAGAFRFAVFFAVGAVRGAVDVAFRAVRLNPRLDPGFLEIDLDLPAGTPRVLFANALSLLPGTLTAELRGDRAIIHVIDRGADLGPELDRLRARVRAVFTEELRP